MFYRFVFALVLLPCSIGAATGNWSAVEALTTPDRIQVTLSNGKIINGNVDHVTPAALYSLTPRKIWVMTLRSMPEAMWRGLMLGTSFVTLLAGRTPPARPEAVARPVVTVHV